MIRKFLKCYPLPGYFGLTFLCAWSVWIPAALSSYGLIHLHDWSGVLRAAGIFAPAIAAVCVTTIVSGKAGIASFFQPLWKWRVGLRWYLIAMFTRIGVLLMTYASYLLTGQMDRDLAEQDWSLLFRNSFFEFLIELPGSGLGEEIGWTGYALPALLSRFSQGLTNLILGLVWAVWHLPLFFIFGDAHYGTSFPLFVVKLVAFRFLFSWVYHRTQGSLLIVVLFHTMFNVALVLFPFVNPNDPLAIALTWCLVVLTLVV